MVANMVKRTGMSRELLGGRGVIEHSKLERDCGFFRKDATGELVSESVGVLRVPACLLSQL